MGERRETTITHFGGDDLDWDKSREGGDAG